MKRVIIQTVLFLIPIFCFSQTDLEIDRLIEKLSWESITYDHTGIGTFVNYKDSSVQKLIQIIPSVTDKLLASIEDTEKTVIIHMILTKILEPDNVNNFLTTIYIRKNCNELIGWHHIFNGLIWEWFPEDNYSIIPQEVEKVKNYWENRISGKINAWKINIENSIDEIEKSDAIKYPCDKVYQNNSAQIQLDNLMELFDYDFFSDKFSDIFTILGNDSTISRYDDCYSVSYDVDGLSFRFDIYNKLKTILIDSDYQGEMPFGLKYTDKKKNVERKIGKPDKSRSVYKDTYVDYTKKRLHIGYDDNKQIRLFVILGKF